MVFVVHEPWKCQTAISLGAPVDNYKMKIFICHNFINEAIGG